MTVLTLMAAWLLGASTAQSDCGLTQTEAMVGTWQGEQIVASRDQWQRWTVKRHADGRFRIDFESGDPQAPERSHETGLWSYSGCQYVVRTQTLNGEAAFFLEQYRVSRLTETEMVYTNLRTGNEYRVTRVKAASNVGGVDQAGTVPKKRDPKAQN